LLDIVVDSVFEIGYLGFFIYMVIVGTFIPLPTQLILLPAGYLVAQGKMGMSAVVLVTALGTTTGALINYHLSSFIAERFLHPHKTRKLKKFFDKYGKLSVLLAPLSFGMGQYISIPAGIARMDLRWFIPLIFISNAIWNIAMLMLGYMFGEDANKEATYLVAGGVIFLIVVVSFFVYRELRSY